MAQHEVTRTLVKSQPEVWTQCSDADSLGRHLSGSFGEIRITRLDPENSVAWEGEEVSGTVRIEPSAWGTRVTLTVDVADEVADLEAAARAPGPETEPDAVAEPEPEPEPEAMAEPQPESPPQAHAEPEPLTTRWERLRAWWRRAASVEPPPDNELSVDDEMLAAADPPAADPTPVVHEPELSSEPEPEPEPELDPGPAAVEETPTSRSDAATALTAALESLGQAHHRPFSRA
jgi:hypothetical protein